MKDLRANNTKHPYMNDPVPFDVDENRIDWERKQKGRKQRQFDEEYEQDDLDFLSRASHKRGKKRRGRHPAETMDVSAVRRQRLRRPAPLSDLEELWDEADY